MKQFFLSLALLVSVTASAWAQTPQRIRVTELFTSTGCPACPPADALFEQLARRDDTLALACHVTYFDRGIRQDPFSMMACNARQLAYQDAGLIDKTYTPQMVMNGKKAVTGSDRKALNKALNNAGTVPAFPVTRTDGVININLPTMNVGDGADVWLVGYARAQRVSERHVAANPVRTITKLLRWDGTRASLAFPESSAPADFYGVIVQGKNHGPIIAAGVAR